MAENPQQQKPATHPVVRVTVYGQSVGPEPPPRLGTYYYTDSTLQGALLYTWKQRLLKDYNTWNYKSIDQELRAKFPDKKSATLVPRVQVLSKNSMLLVLPEHHLIADAVKD